MSRFHKCFQIVTVFFSVLLCIPTYSEWFSGPHVVFPIFTNEAQNRDCTSDRVHGDFSHDVTWGGFKDRSISVRSNNFKLYKASDFQHYFAERGYTSSEILNQRCLYMFDEFVKCVQTYSGYKDTIQDYMLN